MMVEQRYGSRNRKLRAQALNHRREAERVNWEWGKSLNSKVHLQWHTSSSKATPLKTSQARPRTVDQMFTSLRLWGNHLKIYNLAETSNVSSAQGDEI